ncbi:UDP-N-acetyl-alpha-D-glucosamine C6 dehydratase [Paenibacillus sp. P1XP2]|nr:UDP-N-acetyl-alpha-D-glucosamine C6 dehydratase [Paenibacillus sp. P1XP2]
MNTRKTFAMLLIIDMVVVWFSIITSYWFRFDMGVPPGYKLQMFLYAVISTISLGICLYYFRLYRRAWKYASVEEILAIFKAVILGSAISYLLSLFIFPERVPLSIAVRSMETILLLIGGIRFVWRVLGLRGEKEIGSNTIIVGAGDCGTLVARELRNSSLGLQLVGFIDDDLNKLKLQILGYQYWVLGK